MPRQHPRVLPRPLWRSRVAGWLRGFAESLDPAPDGLDLTGAPDFWAEHVRAAARHARKNGRVFRMRRWGMERTGASAAHPEAVVDGRSRPPEPPVSGATRATVLPVPRTVGSSDDATVGEHDSPHRGPETPAAHPSRAGERPAPAGGAVRPLVRPRHAKLPNAPSPALQAPARSEPAVPAPVSSGRGDPPLVRPRHPAASLPAALERLSSAVPTHPTRSDATPGWPRLVPVPSQAPPPTTPDWFTTREVVAAGPVGGWPVHPVPARPREAVPPIAPARLTGPGDGREAPAVAAPPRHEPLEFETAVLPESLWPELPIRRPPVPAMPDPTPLLLRRERLAAEQAAT